MPRVGQPAAVAVLVQGGLAAADVPRQLVRAHPRHAPGHAADPRRAEGRRRLLRVLGAERRRLGDGARLPASHLRRGHPAAHHRGRPREPDAARRQLRHPAVPRDRKPHAARPLVQGRDAGAAGPAIHLRAERLTEN